MSVKTKTSGQLVLSFDFEVGWGTIVNQWWRRRERQGVYSELRPVLRRLLAALDEMEVPATWATVGGMLASPNDLTFDHLPEELQRLSASFASEAAESTRDGRDLFELILGTRIEHEIGFHTYSHASFGTPGYDNEGQEIDLGLGLAQLAKWGEEPVSFVFPENDASSFPPLTKFGLKVARLAPTMSSRWQPTSNLIHRIWSKVGPPPFAQEETLECGLKTQSGSMFFNWHGRPFLGLRRQLVLAQAYRGMRAAVEHGTTVHYWLHPFNLAESPELLSDLVALLEQACILPARDGLRIVRMGDAAIMPPRADM